MLKQVQEPLLNQVLNELQRSKTLTREVEGYNLNSSMALSLSEIVPRNLGTKDLKGNVMTIEQI